MEACEKKLRSTTSGQSLQYRPVRLKLITRDEIRLHNRIAGRSGRIQLHPDDPVQNFQLFPQRPVYVDETCVGFHLSINDKSCWLALSEFFFFDCIERYIPRDNLGDLPEELRSAVIESAFDPLLSGFERAIDTKLAITDVRLHAPIDVLTHSVFFLLTMSDTADVRGYFSFDEALLPLFLNTLERLPVKRINFWDYLPATVRFEIGHTWLKVAELEGIATGDLIFADDCPFAEDQSIAIRIAPNILLEGKLEANKVNVQKVVGNQMDDKDNNTVIELDELQVNLIFDVGEKKIPLREIKTMQPGYIFELNRSAENTVTIRANGQAIGSGELVQTDNNIAVRVLQLFGKIDG